MLVNRESRTQVDTVSHIYTISLPYSLQNESDLRRGYDERGRGESERERGREE